MKCNVAGKLTDSACGKTGHPSRAVSIWPETALVSVELMLSIGKHADLAFKF